MKRVEISEVICSVCSSLRLSQAKTLSVLVPAAMTMARASLAQLGWALASQTGVAAKYGIKRVDRFFGNDRIEAAEAVRGMIQSLARPRQKLLVSLDWVDIRHFQCLVLAARLRGRALPLLWAVYQYQDLYRSQNNLEYGLLRLFRTMVPSPVELTLLADRGFGRTEMARLCQELKIHYVIRLQPSAWVRSRRHTGRLHDYPIHSGPETSLAERSISQRTSCDPAVGARVAVGRTGPLVLDDRPRACSGSEPLEDLRPPYEHRTILP